ncbi:MAG: DUF922 domain-containing protein [Ahrensia sp.]|nr:DUF922 domain-containing protein [Ahrensia sp.]
MAAGLFAIISSLPAQAGLRIKERTKYYSVSGATGKQLFRSIGRRGPQRGHAIATTRTDMRVRNLRTKIRGRKCVVVSADLIVNLTYTLPRLRNSRRVSKNLRKVWNAFAARVNRHEQRHGAISKKYAKRMYRELRRMKGNARRNCADFGDRASKRIAKLQRQAQREHARFDRREASPRAKVRRLQVSLLSAR